MIIMIGATFKRDYRDDAVNHETVFRSILSGKGVETQSSVDEIYREYSTGNRYGKWTILDFRTGPCEDARMILSENEALFISEDKATLSGHGSVEKYKINPDGSVHFDSVVSSWMF